MYTLPKLRQQIGLIQDYWFEQLKDSYEIESTHDLREMHNTLPQDAKWDAFPVDASFAGRDQYYWLRFEVPVCLLAEKEKYLINIGVLCNNDGGNSIPEGLVFADGTPIQAVDANHRDIMLDHNYSEKNVKIAICFWTGLSHNATVYPVPTYTYRDIRGGKFDSAGYECFRYLDVMAQAVAEFAKDEPIKYAYLKTMTQIVKRFDWGRMTPTLFEENIEEALALIQAFIKDHEGEKKQFTISAVGHTHIDVAWLWRLAHTREKTSRSFSTELSLLKDYPDYVFMHSTPQVYQYIKEDYPELFEQINQRIQEGRWEADGAAWVEPDMNIPSGEALTRQFLYGLDYFGEHFDAKQTVLWLPDVFGYSAALPQIMQNFGIKDFMTTKISWNETNHMPHDTFNWQGIDGSEVLTYFITTVDQNYDFRSDEGFGATYNGTITPHSVMGSYYMYQDKPLNDDLLVCFGHGDGGGGPTREMVENIKIINELPGMPTVQPTRVDNYFEKLHQRIKDSEEAVPKWVGELYLEYHRGTYTSQARVKKENRQLELAMRQLEMCYVDAKVRHGVDYPMKKIRELWQIIMRNQFHDILPGSSIKEVYEDNNVEYREAFAGIDALHDKLDEVTVSVTEGQYTLRNVLAWPVQSIIAIENPVAGYFETADHKKLNSVWIDGVYLLETPEVPALGGAVISFVATEEVTETVTTARSVSEIENSRYRIAWNSAGQLTEIYDKKHQKAVLTNGLGNQLAIYEDRPLYWDNWNIDGDYQEKAVLLQASDIQLTEDNNLRKVVTFIYRFHESTIMQKLILAENSSRIDFETAVDWHEHQQLLRTAFTVDILSDHATYDIQYGNVSRPTHRNTSWDEARFESVGHKWADLSQHDYGVALLNDSKYGYDVQGQTISLSLIKSGIWPDPDCDQGEHHFTYSLLPHAGDFVEGQVEVIASELNTPTVAISGSSKTLASLFSFGECNQPVAVDAIKLNEKADAVILRFHDYSGQAGQLTIQPNFDYRKAYQTNLAEVEELPITIQEGQLTIAYRPYQIITLAFTID